MKFSLHFLKRIHPFYYIIGVLFLILIFVSNYASSYIPYHKSNTLASYEGYENEEEKKESFRDEEEDDDD